MTEKYKQELITRIGKQYNLKVLIETGTYLGGMLLAQKDNFDTLYSVECDPDYYKQAIENCKNVKNINISHNHSNIWLPELLKIIDFPVLFWLDAHWKNNPLTLELLSINKHKIKNHALLIDDYNEWRYYSGPDLLDVEKLFSKTHSVVLEENIVRVLPR